MFNVKHDYEYNKLVEHIIKNGIRKSNRTGVDTISTFAYNMRFDISDGTIPLLTTKKIHHKSVIHELLWFINGDTNIKYLNDNGVHIWDEWATADGELGDVYGAMWRGYPVTEQYKLVKRKCVDVPPHNNKDTIIDDFIVDENTNIHDVKLKSVWEYIVTRSKDKNMYLGSGWNVCSKFIHDAKRLRGYVNARKTNEYNIDNNYYGISRVYSLDTCVFNSKKEAANNASGDLQVMLHNDSNKLFFVNIKCAADYLGCSDVDLHYILNKPNNTIRGYCVSILTSSVYVARKMVPIDQLLDLIDNIKTKPNDRRLILNAWNPALLPNDIFSPSTNVELGYQALPPCHAFVQFYVADGKLSCHLYQRSCDVGLGVPFNIAQYSILTHMIAKVTGLGVGEFVWTGGDVHIYENHVEQLSEQIKREPYDSPKLILRDKSDILDYTFDDIKIDNYKHHLSVKMEVAV